MDPQFHRSFVVPFHFTTKNRFHCGPLNLALAVNNMNDHEPHVEAEITLFPTEKGGRTEAAYTGFRPAHKVKDDYLTTGHIEFTDKEKLEPGETGKATIFFITPEVYPRCLWVGKEIALQEGSHVIGCAKITKIMNKTLEKSS